MSFFGIRLHKEPHYSLETVQNFIVRYGERIESLERDFKGMRLEWENTYDKLHSQVAKLNRRQRELDKAQDRAGATNELEGGGTTPSDFRDRILARRRRK